MLTSEVSPPRAAFLDQHPCQSALWKPITQSGIAKLLKPFKIKPSTVRLGAETAKGYKREDFSDAWSRYGVTQAVTPSQPAKYGHFREADAVTSAEDVTTRGQQKPSSEKQCDGVTAGEADLATEEASWTV